MIRRFATNAPVVVVVFNIWVVCLGGAVGFGYPRDKIERRSVGGCCVRFFSCEFD